MQCVSRFEAESVTGEDVVRYRRHRWPKCMDLELIASGQNTTLIPYQKASPSAEIDFEGMQGQKSSLVWFDLPAIVHQGTSASRGGISAYCEQDAAFRRNKVTIRILQ